MLRLHRQQTLRASARRWHSSSSWPPQTKDQNGNSNNTEEASAVEEKAPVQASASSSTTATATAKKSSPVARQSAKHGLKKPISLKPHSATVSNPQTYTVSPPSVNSTQHLDVAMLRTDLFYGGFRPVLTPLRRPVTKTKKTPTIALSWNMSACKLESFDDFSRVPQFVVDKLVPFNSPQEPGNEIRLGAKSRKEQKEMERLTKDVYEFIKHFRK